MKIKKLIESKKLVEAEEEISLAEIDPRTDSVAEIKDAVEGEIEILSNGEVEITDNGVDEIADVTKEVGSAVGAGQVAFVLDDNDFDDAVSHNRLTQTLDKAYKTAKMNMKDGAKAGANVLIEGLPGAGKTAIVENWCDRHGLILVALNATDPKLEAAINGMPLRDVSITDSNELVYAYAKDQLGPLLQPENEGKCVLFVDELNRQKTVGLRRPFMSLFNEKRNASGSLDFRKTLLFSVVCINPFGPQYFDTGVGELIPAEKDRFLYKLYGKKGYDANNKDAIDYWKSHIINQLLKLGIVSPDSTASKNHDGFVGPTRPLSEYELERAKRLIRMRDLALKLLEDEYFSFTTREDTEEIHDEDASYLTSRSLTDGITQAEGNVKEFLEWVDEDSNFSSSAVAMFHNILDGYIMDTKSLYAKYKLEEAPEEEIVVDTEDDVELFAGSGNGSSVRFDGADAEKEIRDIVDAW